MSLPYEILIRAKDGVLRGIAAYDTPTASARPLAAEELELFGPEINTAALARITELEAELADALARPLAPDPAGAISKLTLKRRLDVLGKWSAFKAFLASLGEAAVDEFNLAAEIRADDPMFQQIAPLAKQSLELSDEEYDALLAA